MINTDNIRLTAEQKFGRKTESVEVPFFKRSNLSGWMNEETRLEVREKLAYLTNHMENMCNFLIAYPSQSQFEKIEHGKRWPNAKHEYRKMSSVKYAVVMNEIMVMKFECERLQAILNA